MAADRKYFGTDGVRGVVGTPPMTPEMVRQLGWAAGQVFARGGGGRVVIGRDTRVSGEMLEAALCTGLAAAGVGVGLLGVLPTPAVAYLARELGAVAGAVISASHNPYRDNGIKFFSSEAVKLSDDEELEIERRMEASCEAAAVPGAVAQVDGAGERYLRFCLAAVPETMRLDGVRLAVDCAHGAVWQVAPQVYRSLGAEVTLLGAAPDGRNINRDCGTTSPAALQRAVAEGGADLGIAFDGDGDRVLMVAADGRLVDGDELLFIIADGLHRRGGLRGGVVGTEMSNLGLETALRERGIGFERAAVGDRYVMQKMTDMGWTLGGEPAGHIICLDKTTTGDAIIASLVVLQTLVESGDDLGAAAAAVHKCPQVLVNVPLRRRLDGQVPEVERAAATARRALGAGGRVLVRASGTEPLLRIMVESQLEDTSRLWAGRIADEARRSLGA
ncbi:MAG: phosphoglucosamine mutase [Gammaproteobacteria bacterium]|nr:phosphoglucosamine mutase [Gammaproteobacteria bacterium]